LGISLVGGIVWRRANRWGAAASLILALLVNFYLYHSRNERLDQWDPNIFLASLLAGVAGLFVVSLLTPPEWRTQVAEFFANLDTPSDLGSKIAHCPSLVAPLPQGGPAGVTDSAAELGRWAAEKGRQLLLINLLHLRRGTHGVSFFRAYRDDLKGLVMGSALCAALVIGMWLILQL